MSKKTNQEKRLNHALNNEEVCQFLYDSGKFSDWVITTAFYSALHFVKYKIFPITIEGENYGTFDDYYSEEIRKTEYGRSPHDVLKKLLNRKFRGMASAYHELFDECHNARYVDYDVRKEEVERALGNLSEIKKFCNTAKPTPKKKRPRIKKPK